MKFLLKLKNIVKNQNRLTFLFCLLALITITSCSSKKQERKISTEQKLYQEVSNFSSWRICYFDKNKNRIHIPNIRREGEIQAITFFPKINKSGEGKYFDTSCNEVEFNLSANSENDYKQKGDTLVTKGVPVEFDAIDVYYILDTFSQDTLIFNVFENPHGDFNKYNYCVYFIREPNLYSEKAIEYYFYSVVKSRADFRDYVFALATFLSLSNDMVGAWNKLMETNPQTDILVESKFRNFSEYKKYLDKYIHPDSEGEYINYSYTVVKANSDIMYKVDSSTMDKKFTYRTGTSTTGNRTWTLLTYSDKKEQEY